ncbi:hypothetical protein QBC39DRAFT_105951 [Podospora conica]|nr:hypothetical protein QBC39DRAFT_105951 [Schizothecium conicum]
MTSYKLTVKNQTGGPQDYAFFSAPPIVSGGPSGEIWSNIMRVSPHTPNGAMSTLELSSSYYAICGSFDGTPEQGGQVSVSKAVSVKLGSSDGTNVTRGSTVALTVFEKESCDLGPPTTPGGGKIGNFQLDTSISSPDGAFTIQDAKNNHLLVGIANSKDSDIQTAIGTFVPYPNAKYQIQPQAVIYVSAGQRFNAGDFVKVEMTFNCMAVDFNVRQTNDVTLIHNQDNEFVFSG